MSAPGTWVNDTFTADDGREFAIFSERAMGEDRYYEAKERHPGGGWGPLPTSGGFRKDSERRKVERYVRETMEAAP